MKTFILFLSLFVSASLFAQSYQQFEAKDTGSRVYLEQKSSVRSLRLNEKTYYKDTQYEIVKKNELMKQLAAVFQKYFVGLTDEEMTLLKPVQYVFRFDKAGKIYEFRVHFDKKVEPVILKYEAAIYHFGEELVGFDLSLYIDTFSNPNFAGSDCYIQLFMPMRFLPKE